MTEGVVDAVVIHVGGDVVSMGFDNIGSIVHSEMTSEKEGCQRAATQ